MPYLAQNDFFVASFATNKQEKNIIVKISREWLIGSPPPVLCSLVGQFSFLSASLEVSRVVFFRSTREVWRHGDILGKEADRAPDITINQCYGRCCTFGSGALHLVASTNMWAYCATLTIWGPDSQKYDVCMQRHFRESVSLSVFST